MSVSSRMMNPEIPEDSVNRVVLEIEENYSAGERLDILVTNRLPKISRNRVQKLINEGNITLDGKKAKASAIVQGSSEVVVIFPHPPRPAAAPEDIPLDIIYEDDYLLIVNKPPGMVVHPAAGHHSGTLVNALLGHYKSLPTQGGNPTHRPGIVHRLDKDTSGLIVVARTENVMTALGRLFHEHDIEREYNALVWGNPPDSGTIDAPISRSPRNRKKFAVVEGGRHAVTHWKVVERYGFLTHIAVTLETGRTHQIRVHFSDRGWPIFGDSTYGGKMHGLARLSSSELDKGRNALKLMPRQALHAGQLGFIHPNTRNQIHFEAPLPPDFQSIINLLKE
ncbi:MAG: RluA family pseudouridine synthase [Candidatus Electryonea clarkiae]|nr:RluA family pseudouridine synthase [Candidatus Electryonea clarkiae]MDP8286579.1 RluA family pseudouridine synthase [Candidatus Electryonea clarkiae]